MRCIAGTAAAAILALLLLAGCGGRHPSEAACKAAMKQQYATALAAGRPGHEPAECKGLPDAVLQKLAGQVISGR